MTFADWKESRLHHVVAAKQQSPDTACERCVEWAWLHLEECICGHAQISGWCLVIIAIFVFIPAELSSKTSQHSHCQASHVGLSLACLVTSGVGVAGAMLSMQMILVIAYDATYLVLDFLTSLVTMGRHLVRLQVGDKNRNHLHYQHIPDEPDQEPPSGDHGWKFVCFSALSLTSVAFVCLKQVSSTSNYSKEGRRDLEDSATRQFTTDNRSIGLHELLMVIGYAMGSLACFGHWALQWNTIRLKQEAFKQVTTEEGTMVPSVSSCFLVLSRGLYIIGVLLQSGGWMVAMVTLPWTVKSFIGAHAECYVLLSRHKQIQNKKAKDAYDSDVISLTESGSDTSNILWDKAWKVRGGLDQYMYYEKAKPKCFDVQAMRLMSNNMSTNSDWSSSSDEQELEWENANIAPYNSPSRERKIRLERIINSTPPRAIPLTLTIPESSDQRVITWISNSTPEEEKLPPTLTMALNLDTPPQTPNDHLSSMIGETRKYPHLPPRKNSL